MHLLQRWGQRWLFQHPSLWVPQILNAAYWWDGLGTTREILKWIVTFLFQTTLFKTDWERGEGTWQQYELPLPWHAVSQTVSTPFITKFKISAVAPHAASILTKTSTHCIYCHFNPMLCDLYTQTKQDTNTKQIHRQTKVYVMVGHAYSKHDLYVIFSHRTYWNMQCNTILTHAHAHRLTAIVYGGDTAEVVQVSV